jgi:predicted Rossmann fold flavoprotein
MFCDNSSKNILAMLLEESEQSGVKIIPQCRIQSILKTHKFIIESSRGEFQSDSLVIATGGLSVPSLGATDFGYQIATQFGHRIISPSPALVPLVFNAKEQKKFVELAGISMEAEVRTGKTVFRDDLLFTHKGLSGPAILQISSYWNPGQEIVINLYPYGALDEKLITLKKQYPNKQLDKLMTLVYPERFISHWWKPYEYSKPMIQYPDKELKLIASQFQNWKIVPADTEGYLTAEVTRGGINTRDINPTTMESKRIPGLSFVGEILDVTGWLGGYNFQWAWSSGWAAGQAV